jgi:hypothetical protein
MIKGLLDLVTEYVRGSYNVKIDIRSVAQECEIHIEVFNRWWLVGLGKKQSCLRTAFLPEAL